MARSAWDAVDAKAREAWYFAGGGGDSVGAARQSGFRLNSSEPFDQLIIAQLPQMIAAAADGLSNANLTVLNGAEGLNCTVAALASQGLAILRAVTDGLGTGSALDEFDDAELIIAARVLNRLADYFDALLDDDAPLPDSADLANSLG